MGVSDKIELAKNCFTDIRKSGRNTYQKYNYAELSDINPIVRKICKQYKLRTKFDWDWENNLLTLTITDKEDGSTDKSVIPIAPLNANDPGKYMQDVGRCQTYAMRYLYLQVFEIAIPDEIDNKNQRSVYKQKQVPQKPQQKNVTQQKPTQKPVNTEEQPTEEDIKEALDNVYDLIVTRGGKEFTLESAMFQLQRQYKDQPLLIKACQESLNTNQANKVKTE